LIGASGSGSAVIKPNQTGTVTATRDTQVLTAQVTVNAQVFAPQLTIKRLTDNSAGTAINGAAVTDTIIWSITGAAPNTPIASYNNDTGSDSYVFFKNIGGINYIVVTPSDNSQPPGTAPLVTDAQGNATFRMVIDPTWPFNDLNDTNFPPIDLVDLWITFIGGTKTNPVTLTFTRTYSMKVVNLTKNRLKLDGSTDSNNAAMKSNLGFWSTSTTADWGDFIGVAMLNMDPNTPVTAANLMNGSFGTPYPLIQYLYDVTKSKNTPPTPVVSDSGGGAFFMFMLQDGGESNQNLGYKAYTNGRPSNQIAVSVASMCHVEFSQPQLNNLITAQGAGNVIYNQDDYSQNLLINGVINTPDASTWRPVKIQVKKRPGVTLNLTFNAVSGYAQAGLRIYADTNQFANSSGYDTGVNLPTPPVNYQGSAGQFTIPMPLDSYAVGNVVNLWVKVGGLISKNFVTVVLI
jgi:hypothetical protein